MGFRILAVLAAGVLVASAAQAATEKFTATLVGADEVPANTTAGKGKLTAEFDTANKTLTYHARYTGLTGPATMAHFHGPAMPGENAPVQVPVSNPANPITGTATLTDAQVADLEAGKWYFNVHTKAHPGGEIRGQVQPAK